jgi:GcrA cell cycle regulator
MTPALYWTDERVERLKTLLADGLSSSQIAADLGTTRNAVIGKVTRLGLMRPAKVRIQHAPRAPRVRIRNQGNAGFVVVRQPKIEPEPFIPLEEIEIPVAQRRTLQQLQDRHCRWPVGDPQDEDFYFCGGEMGPGACKPYCRAHARIAYSTPMARAAAKTAAEAERERRRSYKAVKIAEAVAA